MSLFYSFHFILKHELLPNVLEHKHTADLTFCATMDVPECAYLRLCRHNECMCVNGLFVDVSEQVFVRIITFCSDWDRHKPPTSLPQGNQFSPEEQELIGLRISSFQTAEHTLSLYLVMTLIMVITYCCCTKVIFWDI